MQLLKSIAGIENFVLAMIKYPEVLQKAHEEIDRVVGEGRLPTLVDLEHMPYIRAMILEVSSLTFNSYILTNLSSDASISPCHACGYTALNTGRGGGKLNRWQLLRRIYLTIR